MQMQKSTFISFLTLLLFLLLLIIVNFPNPRMVSEINITNQKPNQYLLKLNLPEQIWSDQAEKINIQLINDNSQIGVINEKQDISNFDSKKIQNFEVDWVLPGAELTPAGNSITPIIEENDINMNWGIAPITNQDVIGTVWIYINTISDGDEKINKRELIFTRNLSLKIRSVFGLKIGTIQWILSIFTLLNIIYLFRSFRIMKVFNSFQK